MKLLGILLAFFLLAACEQTQTENTDNEKVQIVEAACGECQFGLEGKSCDLAVRIDGKAYFIDGAKIDEYGDAHDDDGFCEAIRKAEVKGEIVDGRFKASSFKLLAVNETRDK